MEAKEAEEDLPNPPSPGAQDMLMGRQHKPAASTGAGAARVTTVPIPCPAHGRIRLPRGLLRNETVANPVYEYPHSLMTQ